MEYIYECMYNAKDPSRFYIRGIHLNITSCGQLLIIGGIGSYIHAIGGYFNSSIFYYKGLKI